MASTVTYRVPSTADTKPVILRLELVLDVKPDIQEQFVQQVLLFFSLFWKKNDRYNFY